MSTIQTVKTQIQSLIDLANTTTGNQDTNLTDGVNALVGGYGQGGSGGSLEGLENGYDVMFYDENNEGLAFYSIKQGHAINPPEYDCKRWEDSDGTVVIFPYTPLADIILYANNETYASQLYSYYGVDSVLYPYLAIYRTSTTLRIMFGKTYDYYFSDGYCGLGTVLYQNIVANTDAGDIEGVVSACCSVEANLTSYGQFGCPNSQTYYTNFDMNKLSDYFSYTTSRYRLDE